MTLFITKISNIYDFCGMHEFTIIDSNQVDAIIIIPFDTNSYDIGLLGKPYGNLSDPQY